MRNLCVTACAALAAHLLLAAPARAVDDYFPRPSAENFRDPGARSPGADSLPAAGPDSAARLRSAPIPAKPGVPPRIVLRSAAADSAKAAGFPIRRGAVDFYRIEMDSGTVFAVTAPARAGRGHVRIARLMPDGAVRADTLALSGIRSIGIPRTGNQDPAEWGAVMGLMLLPIAYGQGVVPFLAGMGAGVGAYGETPDWTSRPPAEFLDHPHRWSATVALTQGLATRTSMAHADPRRQFAPALRLQLDAGPRWSPLTFGLGARMVSMGSPWSGEALRDSVLRARARRHDSAYAAHGTAFALSPGIAVVWAESPAYTLRTRAGGYFALKPYPDEGNAGESVFAAGPEFGLELDWRPAPHWALRLEGSFLSPTTEYDVRWEPSFGAGLAYGFHARPGPDRASPVLASFSAALSPRQFVPGAQLEQDMDPWQSIGLGVAYSYSDRETLYRYGTDSWNRESKRSTTASLLFTYGLHTDRSMLIHGGVQIVAGVVSHRAITSTESRFIDYQGTPASSSYGYEEISGDFAMGLIPEAGVRLGKGFGLRLRLHALPIDPFAADEDFRASAGLTYALPTGGAGR